MEFDIFIICGQSIPNLKLFFWKSLFDWMSSLRFFSFISLLDLFDYWNCEFHCDGLIVYLLCTWAIFFFSIKLCYLSKKQSPIKLKVGGSLKTKEGETFSKCVTRRNLQLTTLLIPCRRKAKLNWWIWKAMKKNINVEREEEKENTKY